MDRTRGPLNEGGLYAERQGMPTSFSRTYFVEYLVGWHLPGFDDSNWAHGKPTEGISEPGVAFLQV